MDSSQIIEQYKLNVDLYKRFTIRIEKLLSELIEARKIEIHSISSRTKLLEKLSEKLNRKARNDGSGGSKYNKLSDITDISGIRIITYYEKETDDIANLIKEEFDVDFDNSIDKGASLDPDRFGYVSKHFVVKLLPKRSEHLEFSEYKELFTEIQIRTILQHAWAENEHNLGYKNANGIPVQIKRRFARMSSLLEVADNEFSQIRNELANHAKYVEENISRQNNDLFLDRISLCSFMENNKTITSLDREIIPSNCKLEDPSNSEIDNRVRELRFNGIRTIKDLESAISKYKENLVKFAKGWIKEQGEFKIYSFGISLFYLCYVILAEKKCEELTIEYLNRCTIGLDYERIETAKRIAQVYTKIVSI